MSVMQAGKEGTSKSLCRGEVDARHCARRFSCCGQLVAHSIVHERIGHKHRWVKAQDPQPAHRDAPPPGLRTQVDDAASCTGAEKGMGGPGELQVSCEVVRGEVCRIQNWVVAQGSGGGGKAPSSQGFSRDGAHEACGRLRAGWRRLETRRKNMYWAYVCIRAAHQAGPSR